MAQSIKKRTPSEEVRRIINEEWERLQEVPGMNTDQSNERERICNALGDHSRNIDRGLMGLNASWLRSVNKLLDEGYNLRGRVLRSGPSTASSQSGVPLHTVRVAYSGGNYTLTTNLNDFNSVSGRSKLLEATHENGTRLVLKRITDKPFDTWTREFREKRQRDIDLWAGLSHPNILPFLGTTEIAGYRYAVSKRSPRGDFLYALQRTPKLPVLNILWRTANAIRCMHEKAPPLIHGDIKPENIFLEDDFNPLLSDFANMKRLGHDTTAERKAEASVYIKSPEAWDNKTRTRETDVYAFGITIAWALLKGAPPFSTSASASRMYTTVVVQGLRPVPPPGGFGSIAEADAWTLAARCWAHLPESRPKIEEVAEKLGSLAGMKL